MKRKRVRGWRPRQTYVWGHERPGARLSRLRALLPLQDLEVDRAMQQGGRSGWPLLGRSRAQSRGPDRSRSTASVGGPPTA